MVLPRGLFGPGQVALVTGAASGIGLASTVRLVEEGASGLVLLDRDETGLRRVAATLGLPAERVLWCAQDVADEPAWETTATRIAERFGRLDLAVANAGVTGAAAIVDCSMQEWRRIMAVNLDGVFLTLRCGLKLIRQGQRGGAIVVVASATGIKAEVGTAAYGASKAGALQLARVAAKEGAPDQIRVNAVLPGGVTTPLWRAMPFFQDLLEQTGSEEAAFTALASAATPLGRYATAEEIAEQIVWLLSNRTALMTGAALVIDGGYTV
jgi:2-keto-3-deoxy-L-fuconate dehydrogenase